MKNKLIALHLLIWSVFIGYEVLFLYFTITIMPPLLYFAAFYAVNMVLFYFTAHVILEYAFFKSSRPVLLSVILILLEIPVYLLIKNITDTLVVSPLDFSHFWAGMSQKYLVTNTWRGMYFIGLSIAYFSMNYFIRYREKAHHMETEKLKKAAESLALKNRFMQVENAYLHNQISPHLLFNSLNFIFSKVRNISNDAGNSVMMLSNLMRYSLVTDDEQRLVSLAEEAEQIGNLLALSRLRYGGNFHIRFVKKGRLSRAKVIPLVLITLVENIIKHGELEDKQCPALIDLRYEKGKLNFYTRNKKRKGSPYTRGGLGLKNIQKRLRNTYENYSFEVDESEEYFTLTLTIDEHDLLPGG